MQSTVINDLQKSASHREYFSKYGRVIIPSRSAAKYYFVSVNTRPAEHCPDRAGGLPFNARLPVPQCGID